MEVIEFITSHIDIENWVLENINKFLLDILIWKDYVMYDEHLDGEMIEMEYHNIDFLEEDFLSISSAKKDS